MIIIFLKSIIINFSPTLGDINLRLAWSCPSIYHRDAIWSNLYWIALHLLLSTAWKDKIITLITRNLFHRSREESVFHFTAVKSKNKLHYPQALITLGVYLPWKDLLHRVSLLWCNASDIIDDGKSTHQGQFSWGLHLHNFYDWQWI